MMRHAGRHPDRLGESGGGADGLPPSRCSAYDGRGAASARSARGGSGEASEEAVLSRLASSLTAQGLDVAVPRADGLGTNPARLWRPRDAAEAPTVTERTQRQLDYYFSESNLRRDAHLRGLCSAGGKDGTLRQWVPLAHVLEFVKARAGVRRRAAVFPSRAMWEQPPPRRGARARGRAPPAAARADIKVLRRRLLDARRGEAELFGLVQE